MLEIVMVLNVQETADHDNVLSQLADLLDNEIGPSLLGCAVEIQRRVLITRPPKYFAIPAEIARKQVSKIDANSCYMGDEPTGWTIVRLMGL